MTREELARKDSWILAVIRDRCELTSAEKEYLNVLIEVLEQEPKTDKALKLLAEWAIECGFGYDNIPEQYETYKDDIADMGYVEGLAYIAQMESEG